MTALQMSPDVTVADIESMLADRNAFRGHVLRSIAAKRGTYQEFIKQLYIDLDACIGGLRSIVAEVQGDNEDRLTADIVLQLSIQGYVASHDKKVGGHIDITVESGPHTWIGEAKLDWGIGEGFKQLTTRYATPKGNPNHDHGGLLFYLKRETDTNAVMLNWRKKLEAQGIPCEPCPDNPLAFTATIKLEGTGLPFHVRSIGVSLYFKPEDASGVKTRMRRGGLPSSES